jgi:hypothetical protein
MMGAYTRSDLAYDDDARDPAIGGEILAPRRVPGTSPFGNESTRPAGHSHLWILLDGTPAHAPPGRLVTDEDGQLACHLCGQWFVHLGVHLRRHGWTAAQYREAVGLELHVPLCSTAVSGEIAARQKLNWDRSPQPRIRFAPGHELARSGELSRRSAAAARTRRDSGRTPEEVRAARARRLDAGRATQAEQQKRRADAVVAAAGATSLHELLRLRYGSGSSIDRLAKETGLGRGRLRAELAAAGVIIRPSGVNAPASKQARAARNDALVAGRVGTADLRRWLLAQRRAGVTLRELAQRTGRSIPWVQSRLACAAGV